METVEDGLLGWHNPRSPITAIQTMGGNPIGSSAFLRPRAAGSGASLGKHHSLYLRDTRPPTPICIPDLNRRVSDSPSLQHRCKIREMSHCCPLRKCLCVIETSKGCAKPIRPEVSRLDCRPCMTPRPPLQCRLFPLQILRSNHFVQIVYTEQCRWLDSASDRHLRTFFR